jgi:hypothetical protein
MNKGMIMLGLLLIVGLSFAWAAGPWQNQWQNYTSWRYDCNIGDIGLNQYYLAADYMYVNAQPYIPYSQITSMYGYLYYMQIANNNMMWTMMEGNYDYYPGPFRVDMAAYNSNGASFKAIFNAVLRTYLQHGGDRTYVLGMLNGFNSDYRECIGRTPWTYPPPPPISLKSIVRLSLR